MKLLKDFIDKTNVISNLKEVNLPQLGSNAGYNPVNIIQGFWLAIFTGTSRYIHADFFHKFDMETNSEIFPLLQH